MQHLTVPKLRCLTDNKKLSDLIKFFKQAANKISELTDEKDEIIAIIETVEMHSKLRHDLVHGLNFNYLKENAETQFLARPKRGQNIPQREDAKPLDAKVLFEHFVELNSCGIAILALTCRVIPH